MADEEVQIESAAGELTSGIQRSSAVMMEAAYLPSPSKRHEESGALFFKTPHAHRDEEVPGPNGRVYITKISNRIPDAGIKGIPGEPAKPVVERCSHDFYTVIFFINLQLDEPSTTRFINATVSFVSPPLFKILSFSPKEKEKIIKIGRTVGDRIFLSPSLEFSASAPQYAEGIRGDPVSRFEVYVGPEEKMCVTYHKKYGYAFLVPKCDLLEYEGMRNNEHEVSFEIYPPMPPNDREPAGNGKHAIVSFIVQVPCNSSPEILVRIAGKVKGEIWGVVPVKGQVDFLTPHSR